MLVLGIETSCDETGIALFDSESGLLADALYSQVEVHAEYGGVVPELAARDHIRKTLPLIKQVMSQANCTAADVNGIAYTAGPGLVGALMVGGAIASSLAYAWAVPSIAVHHMEGHLLAPMLEDSPPAFPFVALLVSGAHTQLVKVGGIGHYQLLGESLDDAAGEAFDKAAKMLDMDYPGGPHIARCARSGDRSRFTFPRPMTNRPGLDFSFSGLKTFTLNTVKDHSVTGKALEPQLCADIAVAFQDAVVDTLVIKCRRALQHTGLKTLLIAGGVSANQYLREKLQEMVAKEQAQLCYARQEFCTDNGAMIAYAGCQRLLAGQQNTLAMIARPRWPMEELSAI